MSIQSYVRPVSRLVARELSEAELSQIAGGDGTTYAGTRRRYTPQMLRKLVRQRERS